MHKRAGKVTLIVLVILVAILAAGCNEKKEVEKETEITGHRCSCSAGNCEKLDLFGNRPGAE